jgi:hypothetical protein
LGKWFPDIGSYVEIGPEYGNQNNLLYADAVPLIGSTFEK